MIRKIVHINEEKCNGCGACASACHEGAIKMVNGKAKLLRDDYCDGLGDCLPACPTGAISFEEREAAAYDETAVKKHLEVKKMIESMNQPGAAPSGGGCPGQRAMSLKRNQASDSAQTGAQSNTAANVNAGAGTNVPTQIYAQTQPVSQLAQWPVQIKLVPTKAAYFDGAKLLIAADCTAYAYANFHNQFIKDHITVIGCPKLDAMDYTEKLTAILANNNIKSMTVVRMEVPCCGGLEHAAVNALKSSGKFIPWQVVTIGIDGTLITSL